VRDAGLPRVARLRRSADFLALRQTSGRLGGRCFSVRYRANGLGLARLGLAVSRRVSKRAVERNRLKRLVRESFRRERAVLPAFDILVIAQAAAAGQPGDVLAGELQTLWRRLAALKPSEGAGTIVR
jgi:ribonuclease P protein component